MSATSVDTAFSNTTTGIHPHMALGIPITVRLAPEKRHLLARVAAAEGKPFSTFLREIIEAGGQRPASLSDSDSDPAMLAEVLLLLRAVSGPDKVRLVQAELKRQGMTPWTGS